MEYTQYPLAEPIDINDMDVVEHLTDDKLLQLIESVPRSQTTGVNAHARLYCNMLSRIQAMKWQLTWFYKVNQTQAYFQHPSLEYDKLIQLMAQLDSTSSKQFHAKYINGP